VDDTDRQLLGILRDDGRATVAAIAKRLRVARGTVRNRMARLEADGTITGYTVRLKPHTVEQRIRGLMMIAVEGNKDEPILKVLRGDPDIVGLHTTNGRWDMVADVRADNLQAFERVLIRIRELDGITNTETSLLLSTHKL
jgi:DNA-binding Lrp family transcriptional regulator